MSLVPCASCSRHVRSSESSCPFCSAPLSPSTARVVPAAERRLERLAAFTFAATIAVTGCTLAGEEDTDQKEDELGAVQPMYGMPPAPAVDAGKDSGKDAGKDAAKDADVDAQDAAPPCPPPVNDDGGVFAMYGAPAFEPCPVPEEDAGAMQPMYGMPPSEPFEE